jgi:hypothetical protein
MATLKQSTAYNRTFLLVESADHITGLTGASPSVYLSKAGGAFGGAITATVHELSYGQYYIALTTGDTDTLGDLAFHVTAASGDPTDFVDQITANILGDTLPASVAGAVGSVTGLTASDVGAIKTQTDKMAFTVTHKIDANILAVNSVTVNGNGAGIPWGP